MTDSQEVPVLGPTKQDQALNLVGELLKLIPATAGVMLALIWGLAGNSTQHDVLKAARAASIVLVVSIFFAFLGLQFIVSRLQKNGGSAGDAAIQLCFLGSWLAFFAGCGLVIRSLFLV